MIREESSDATALSIIKLQNIFAQPSTISSGQRLKSTLYVFIICNYWIGEMFTLLIPVSFS